MIVETVSYNFGTRAFNFVAKKQNIPIIELQHGVFHNLHIRYVYFIPVSNIKDKLLPDKILVYGKFFKETILTTGSAFLSEDIKIVGFSRLTNFLKECQRKYKPIRKEVRKRLGTNNNIFLITISSNLAVSSHLLQFFKKTLPLLEKNINICIKLHPMSIENEKLIYKDIAHYPQIKIITDDMIDFYQLLVASDVHATINSTVFLECLVPGVPNIIIRSPDRSILCGIIGQNKIITVNTAKEFINEINKLQKKNYREMIIKKGKEMSSYFYSKNNFPEDSIVNEILNDCNKNRRISLKN